MRSDFTPRAAVSGGEAEGAGAIEELERALARGGLHAALAYLNRRTRHRFTAVYRFDPPILRNVALFDRENPSLRVGGDVPMRETYCSLIRESCLPFTTPDAEIDGRLADHPARARVLAYCGVPLETADGSCFGVLCHWDARPRLVIDAEVPFLLAAAPLIVRAM